MDLEKLVIEAAVIKAAFDVTDDINNLMSAIGTNLDFWAVEHGYGAEDVERALKALLSAAEDAHRVIGMPVKEGN